MRAAPVRRIAFVHCLLLVALVVLALSIPAWAEPIDDVRHTRRQDRPSGRMVDPRGEDLGDLAGRDAAWRPRFAGGTGPVAPPSPEALAEETGATGDRFESVLREDLLDVEPGYLCATPRGAGEVSIASAPSVLGWGLAGTGDDAAEVLPKSLAGESRPEGELRQLALALLADLKTPAENLADAGGRAFEVSGPQRSGAVEATMGNPLPVPILWAFLAAGAVGMFARRLRMI